MERMLPVLKWAGGKRKLADMISKNINLEGDACYFEPFLGGAAVLLNLTPKKAICLDKNNELINFYNVVKNNVNGLIKELNKNYSVDYNTSDFYYRVREIDRNQDMINSLTKVERAARFLYLNKTCYNGLWRGNKNGQNNVPFGRYKKPVLYKTNELLKLNEYFTENDIKFICSDYSYIKKYVKAGDIIYFDPPYDVENGQSEFVDYTLGGFSRKNQKELKELCDCLVKKGAKVLISNSKTKYILNLYNDKNYNVYTINDSVIANRSIGSNANSRKKVEEVLIIGVDKNYEKNSIPTSK